MTMKKQIMNMLMEKSEPMKAQHTKGPWRELKIDGDWKRVIIADDSYGNDTIALTQEANARLIAAAPDLLEVLKEVADFWAGGDCPESLWSGILTTISKAEGGTK